MYGHFDPKSNSMYIDLSDEYALKRIFTIIQNKKVLPNKEVIESPSGELDIIIRYANITPDQLEAAKQEITDALYDFHELYGIEKYGTKKTITVFIHDNKDNYFDYAGIKPKEGHTIILAHQYSRESENIANIFYYPSWESYQTLRYQISETLSHGNYSKILPEQSPDEDDTIEPINPDQDNNLPSEAEPNHERKIIAHLDSKGHIYINTLDILKVTTPEAFDKNGDFKYLDKTDNAYTGMNIILKDVNKNYCDHFFYEGIDRHNVPCINRFIAPIGEPDDRMMGISIHSHHKQCDIKKLFTDNDYSKIYLNEVPKDHNRPIFYVHEFDPLCISKKNSCDIFKGVQEGVQDSDDIPAYASHDYLF